MTYSQSANTRPREMLMVFFSFFCDEATKRRETKLGFWRVNRKKSGGEFSGVNTYSGSGWFLGQPRSGTASSDKRQEETFRQTAIGTFLLFPNGVFLLFALIRNVLAALEGLFTVAVYWQWELLTFWGFKSDHLLCSLVHILQIRRKLPSSKSSKLALVIQI